MYSTLYQSIQPGSLVGFQSVLSFFNTLMETGVNFSVPVNERNVQVALGKPDWSDSFVFNDTAYGNLRLDNKAYHLSLMKTGYGNAHFEIWGGKNGVLGLSECQFRCERNTLHILEVKTHVDFRNRGLASALQRLAYAVAGHPEFIIRHSVLPTNPEYGIISSAHIMQDTGEWFVDNTIADSVGRRFGISVKGLRVLSHEQNTRDSQAFNSPLLDEKTFDVEIAISA